MKKSILKTAIYTLLLSFAYIAFQALFLYIAMLVAMIYAASKGIITIGNINELINYEVLKSTPETSSIYVWATSIGLFVSALAMLLFIHSIKGYRLKPALLCSISPKPLLHSTLLVLSSMFALNIFVQWLGLKDNAQELLGELTHNALGVTTIALLAPLLEEVLFRGAIQGQVMRRYNPWTGIIFASLLFGIIHWNPIQSAYATLIGVILGWIYYRTGSLLSVIVGHVLNNSIAAMALLFFPESEATPIPDGIIPPATQATSEVLTFIFFATLSIHFAIKLHKTQPPVPSPWRDTTDAV